ncbi:MCE family protein [Mycolicibacterium moriokaense]|nr:MCE family protein [Mycolicibacterium moriokaense]
MRGNVGRTAIRVAVYTAVSLTLTLALVAVFGQLRFESRTEYHADFTNVSGLKSGNFVRIAGVEVGKISGLHLHRDGTVTVDFAINNDLLLTEGTRAVIRYENLIGDRYLSLEDGPGSVRRLDAGQTIPLARTAPALDLDTLIGGFRPLFRALEPDQLNELTGELLRVFQGQGGTVASVLAQTSTLTSALADRGEVIGELIKNLDIVLKTFATRNGEFSETLDRLSQLVAGLADRKADIANGVTYINAGAARVADLLTEARAPLKEVVGQTDRTAKQVMADHDYFEDLIKTLPDTYQVLARQGLSGDFFNFYLCEAVLKVNGKGGQPVYVKLVDQPSGRCTPK